VKPLPEPIYLSGPMTGYADFNRPAFVEACALIRAAGLSVLSPHEVGEVPGATWADYLRKDLVLLANARSVVVLRGWECSRGSRLEVHIAHALGMPVLAAEGLIEALTREGVIPRKEDRCEPTRGTG